jgi:hypothetical protein
VTTPPDYDGGSLLNLVAELEHRLIGTAPHPGLHRHLADAIPEAHTYVLVLFDGLGDHQLEHPRAEALAASRVGALDAPFPTTTTVSLATIATGRSPAEHGLLGYQLWLPEVELVVNTIKWTSLWGEPFVWDHGSFLPAPNTWERLAGAGAEPISLQPHTFANSPLSRTLYRGTRFEPWADEAEAARAACQLAAEPGRLILLYVPHVDFAAHTAGQESEAYSTATAIAAGIWERVALGLPDGAVAVGTADHGHIDIPARDRAEIPRSDHEGREFGGDARALFVYGDTTGLQDLPGTTVPRSDMEHWWGPGTRHPAFDDRAPDAVVMADPGRALLHRHADDRLIGHHGGLSDAERRIPLLVAARS